MEMSTHCFISNNIKTDLPIKLNAVMRLTSKRNYKNKSDCRIEHQTGHQNYLNKCLTENSTLIRKEIHRNPRPFNWMFTNVLMKTVGCVEIFT